MKSNAKKVAGLGLLTAMVIVLQLLGSFIRLGVFSVSLVLIPIVVGAALYGAGAGAWLGGVFGAVVLCQPDTALFWSISAPGTVLTVLLKGILAGLLCGLLYRSVAKKHRYAAVVCAAVACPLVNTGIFLLGCRLFFYDWVLQQAGSANAFVYMITGLVGLNFLLELIVNVVLSPAVVRLVDIGKKKTA